MSTNWDKCSPTIPIKNVTIASHNQSRPQLQLAHCCARPIRQRERRVSDNRAAGPISQSSQIDWDGFSKSTVQRFWFTFLQNKTYDSIFPYKYSYVGCLPISTAFIDWIPKILMDQLDQIRRLGRLAPIYFAYTLDKVSQVSGANFENAVQRLFFTAQGTWSPHM